MQFKKAKYKLTTKGTIVFFTLYMTGAVIFGLAFGLNHYSFLIIGSLLMLLSIVLVIRACYEKLGWCGMSREKTEKIDP